MKEASAELFKKAERAIQSAKRELKAGDTEASVSRAYYAMFYVSDYEIGATISMEEVSAVIQQAREFLEAARQYLSKSHSP